MHTAPHQPEPHPGAPRTAEVHTWLHRLAARRPAPQQLQPVRVPARLAQLEPDQLIREVGEW